MSDPVARVRAALLAAGHEDTIAAFPEGTRTAADAAAAIGCAVAQIAKSIVFKLAAGGAAIVVTSGANRVDRARAGAALGARLVAADPAFVLEATGFAAGGVAPVGLGAPAVILLDEDLLALDPVWAAAGSPRHVFRARHYERTGKADDAGCMVRADGTHVDEFAVDQLDAAVLVQDAGPGNPVVRIDVSL